VSISGSEPIAIIGAGSIGAAWGIVFARAGHHVRLYDVDATRLQDARDEIAHRLVELDRAGLLDPTPDDVLARITLAASLAEAVRDVVHVQECVLESLPVKRDLFAQLDSLTGSSTVMASSTSMIPCSEFADGLPGRERCLVVHPGNPPYLLPVVEMAPAPFTADWVIARTRSLLTSARMVPVLVGHENEGFIFNRLQGALLREAYCLVRDGVASPKDVDLVVTAGLGRRWSVLGPFATAELNTRGGIKRHAELLGPAYARMGAERGQLEWTSALVDRVAADVHERLPSKDWAENVHRRDQALMLLEQARQLDPDLFDRLA
jgi:L-gulonate 3-dehydrogenase